MAKIHINVAEAEALSENPIVLRELAKLHTKWGDEMNNKGELLGRDMAYARSKILRDAAFFIDGKLE